VVIRGSFLSFWSRSHSARAAGFGPLLAALPVLCLLPPYAVLTGLPGSVIRAAGVGALALVAPLLGRRLDTLRALGLVYAASVAWFSTVPSTTSVPFLVAPPLRSSLPRNTSATSSM
jgi:predicted membrane metal-binding protein